MISRSELQESNVDILNDADFGRLISLWQECGTFSEIEIASAAKASESAARTINALNAHRFQDWEACVDWGLKQYKTQRVLPNQFLGMMADAAERSGRNNDVGYPILEFAENAIAEGKLDLATGAIKACFSHSHLRELESDQNVVRIANDLDAIARQMEPIRPRKSFSINEKPIIALVSVNLVDDVLAYCKRVMDFARHIDRSKYEPVLYFTECSWEKRPQEFSVKLNTAHSTERAPKFCAELGKLGIKTVFCPPLPYAKSARWLARKMEQDRVDGAVFQGSVTSVIMWLVSRISHIPAKACLCTGINMYQEGQDVTIYRNQFNLDRETEFWDDRWGKQVFIGGGADIDLAQSTPAPDRSFLGLPEDAVVFGMLSNTADQRVTKEYLDCVCKVLKMCPSAYFLCMGAGQKIMQKEYMLENDLADRCRWLPQQKDAFSALKLLDFYYNEFPRGGSQVIRECMACGIPATAMHYSNKHHESVGADIVGRPHNIPQRDPEAFIQRAIEWIQSPEKRQQAAKDLFDRACNYYSAATFVNQMAELLVQIRDSKEQ